MAATTLKRWQPIKRNPFMSNCSIILYTIHLYIHISCIYSISALIDTEKCQESSLPPFQFAISFVEPSLIAHRHACPPTHTPTPIYKHMLLCVSARIWDCAEHNLESVPFGCRRSGFLDDSQCAIKPNKMANAHCRSRSNTIITQLPTHTHTHKYIYTGSATIGILNSNCSKV